ncbi:unnamed protein product [Ambrosiozyma monospora]|uniref:Unnamed protein product n=1 Tax=Ambrosiozyma monospora TaxID=43982 RepID=A0A9W6Z3T3_AMBMO|nr:unnamed protein product [Ambrosiozyma monospora]
MSRGGPYPPHPMPQSPISPVELPTLPGFMKRVNPNNPDVKFFSAFPPLNTIKAPKSVMERAGFDVYKPGPHQHHRGHTRHSSQGSRRPKQGQANGPYPGKQPNSSAPNLKSPRNASAPIPNSAKLNKTFSEPSFQPKRNFSQNGPDSVPSTAPNTNPPSPLRSSARSSTSTASPRRESDKSLIGNKQYSTGHSSVDGASANGITSPTYLPKVRTSPPSSAIPPPRAMNNGKPSFQIGGGSATNGSPIPGSGVPPPPPQNQSGFQNGYQNGFTANRNAKGEQIPPALHLNDANTELPPVSPLVSTSNIHPPMSNNNSNTNSIDTSNIIPSIKIHNANAVPSPGPLKTGTDLGFNVDNDNDRFDNSESTPNRVSSTPFTFQPMSATASTFSAAAAQQKSINFSKNGSPLFDQFGSQVNDTTSSPAYYGNKNNNNSYNTNDNNTLNTYNNDTIQQ